MPRRIRVRVYRRTGRKFYQAEWRDPVTGKAQTKSLGVERKRDADRKAGEIEADLNAGRHRPDITTTWKQFRERYKAEVFPQVSEGTRAKYDAIFNHLERLIQPRFLASVGPAELSRLQMLLKQEGWADLTIKTSMNYLLAALRWAAEHDLMHACPKLRVHRAAGRSKGRPLNAEEFERMLEAVPDVVSPDQVAAFTRLVRGLWLSGLRLGEAMELRWNHGPIWVDLKSARPVFHITVETDKGRQSRIFPIAPDFADMLRETHPDRRLGYVFEVPPRRPDLYDTRDARGVDLGPPRLSLDRTSEVIQTIGEKAGIVVGRRGGREQKPRDPDAPPRPTEKYASAHDFRRSFGFRWALKVTPAVLMALMRHKEITTTLTYYVGQDVQALADALYANVKCDAADC